MRFLRTFMDKLARNSLMEEEENEWTTSTSPRIQKNRRRTNQYLNILLFCIRVEAMCAVLSTDSMFAEKYGTGLRIFNVGFMVTWYLCMLMGVLFAQAITRSYLLIPYALKTVYVTLYGLIAIVFLKSPKPIIDSSENCGQLQEACLLILQFPYNLFREEKNGDLCLSKKVLLTENEFAVVSVVQLLQLFMVIECWKFISHLRSDSLIQSCASVIVNGGACKPVVNSDRPLKQEAVTPKSDSPPDYGGVTPDYHVVTAGDVPPNYKVTVAKLTKQRVSE